MRRNWKRVMVRVAAAASAAAVALLVTVSASARDGHGSGDAHHAVALTLHHSQSDVSVRVRRDDAGRDDDEGQVLLLSSLAPSLPTDPAVHAVAAGGAPWVLKRGSVLLKADGRIHLNIRGLVIPIAHGTFPAGTARPVTVVSASLYCAPEASAAVATTRSVPISEGGDATIEDAISLPSSCLAPIVLVHPNDANGVYIAATGWRH